MLLSADACCTARLQLVRGAGARGYRSMSSGRRVLSRKPVERRCCCRLMGQTDRPTDERTDARAFHGPCCAYRAGRVNDRSHLAMRCDLIMTQNQYKQWTFLAVVTDAFHTSLPRFNRNVQAAVRMSRSLSTLPPYPVSDPGSHVLGGEPVPPLEWHFVGRVQTYRRGVWCQLSSANLDAQRK